MISSNHYGDLVYVLDTLHETESAINEAKDLTDIFSLEDVLELIHEAAQIQEGLIIASQQEGMA